MDINAIASLFALTPEQRASAAAANPALAPLIAALDAQLAATEAAARAAALAEARTRKPRAAKEPTWWDVGVGEDLGRLASLFDCADLAAFVKLVEDRFDADNTSGSLTASAGPLRVVVFHDKRITDSAFAGRINEILTGSATEAAAAAAAAAKLIKAARGVDRNERDEWRKAREADVKAAQSQRGADAPAAPVPPVLPGDDAETERKAAASAMEALRGI